MENDIKMYFNGMLTEKQIIAIVVIIISIVLIISLAKKVVKIILIVGVVIIGLIYFNIVSPEKIVELENVIEDKGEKVIQDIANTSDNIEIIYKDTKLILKVRPDNSENFININDIDRITEKDNKLALIDKDDNIFVTTDKNVIKLLNLFRK